MKKPFHKQWRPGIKFYKAAFYINSITQNDIVQPLRWVGLVVGIAVQVIVAKNTNTNVDFYKTYSPSILILLYIVITLSTSAIIKNLLVLSGADFIDDLFTTHFNSCGGYFTFKTKKLTPPPVNLFADKSHISKLLDLSEKAYSGTIWQMGKEKKKEHLQASLAGNDKSILLIKAPISFDTDYQIIGYTHLVPVTYSNWNKFNNRVKEVGFSEKDFLSYKSKTDLYASKVPFGLIFFTVLGVTHTLYNLDEIASRKKISQLLCDNILMHLSYFLSNEFKYFETIPITFQTIDHKIQKKLKPLNINPKTISKDAIKTIAIEVLNPIPNSFVPIAWFHT